MNLCSSLENQRRDLWTLKFIDSLMRLINARLLQTVKALAYTQVDAYSQTKIQILDPLQRFALDP
jgi:hypothetical protein